MDFLALGFSYTAHPIHCFLVFPLAWEALVARGDLRSLLAMVDAREQNVWHGARQFDVQPDLKLNWRDVR